MCLYVRELRFDEGRYLQHVLRRSKDRIKIRRAQVILSSAQGFKVPRIAERFYFSFQHVRSIIRQFNQEGIAALDPRYGIGRPEKFSEEQKSIIIETALCPPDLLGKPFRRWSLAKLREYFIEEKIIISVSLETLRQILRGRKTRLRRTKTWKECNNPHLRSKKNGFANT
jgi:transposase